MSNNEMKILLGEGTRITARYKDFSIDTDQSEKNGGMASAPEPFDLFLASLGTCAGIYVLGFCQRRNIPHQGVRLVQSWERDEKTRRIDTIRIEIEVPPEFPEKYHAALVRAASQCAVKKTMEDPPEFQVETVTS